METKNQSQSSFAPVVSVLGHVDHGKTSLLDKIRETRVASREAGLITQKIGASEIEIKHEGKNRKITFIDTPGHEAFANMRSQGVSAADIVLLVIASDDGIKPQTRESIIKILEAKIPYIVVFTKIDVEGSNIEKIKQQLTGEGILLEGLGGEVPFIGVSSKTGEKIKDLLELIILVYDMAGNSKNATAPFMGVIIDAKQDKKRGIVSTVVVKSGKISISDQIYTHGRNVGKIRAIINSSGKNIKEALPGEAIEILGTTEILIAGSVLFDREVALEKVADKLPMLDRTPTDIMKFLSETKPDIIPIILKTESTAEIEAIKNALPEKVFVISEGQGDIGVADILLAHSSRALVLGFNVGVDRTAVQLSESEKVFYKSYDIIYKLLEELDTLISAIAEQDEAHEIGRGKILASFLGSSGVIIGLKITGGRLAVGDKIKVMRGEKELGNSKIASIKHGKEDIRVANMNTECGIMIEPDVDFAPQDDIIAYSKS